MSFSRQAAHEANGVEKGTVVHPECRGKEARNSSKEARGISEIAGATCSKRERWLPQVFWARGGGTVRYPTRETGGRDEVPLGRFVQEQRLR